MSHDRHYPSSSGIRPYYGPKLMAGSELQGHAIKNKDLLAASGAITLKGSDVLDELQEDEMAVRREHCTPRGERADME